MLVTLLVGCAAEHPEGGQRVLPIVMRAEGVPDRVVAWQDTELGVECIPGLAADQAQRCLPNSQYGFANLYLDAGCTSDLFFGPPCEAGGPPLALQIQYRVERPWPSEVVELEPAPQELPALFDGSVYDAQGRRQCVPASDLALALFRAQSKRALWQRKRVIDPRRFVRVVGEERSEGTPTIVRDVLDDGARVGREVRGQDGTGCALVAFAQGGSCLQGGATQFPFQFADAQCSEPTYLADQPSLIVASESGCDDALPSARVYAAEPLTTPAFQIGKGGECVAVPADRTLYVQGAERDFASLPQVQLRREGSARLEALSFLDDRGASLGIARYWDRELSIYCAPALAEDGSYRCLPLEYVVAIPIEPSCEETQVHSTCKREGALARMGTECGSRGVRLGALGEPSQPCLQSVLGYSRRPAEPQFRSAEVLPAATFAPFERVVP